MSGLSESGAAANAVTPHVGGEQHRVEVNKEKLRYGDIVFFRMIADGVRHGTLATKGAGLTSECNPFLQAEGYTDERIGMIGDDPDPKKFHYVRRGLPCRCLLLLVVDVLAYARSSLPSAATACCLLVIDVLAYARSSLSSVTLLPTPKGAFLHRF